MNLDKEKLQQVLDEATSSGEECGCQLAIYQNGKPILSLFSGWTNSDRKERVTDETLFPIFSCGKGVAATMIHILAERGIMNYNDKIADFWPEFGCLGKENIRLWQVLSHRSGLHVLPELDSVDRMSDWEYMCRKMEQSVPTVEPGTKCNYQGITFSWLLGEPIRRATGKTMQELIREEIFRKLGIDDSFVFGTTAEQDRKCAGVDASRIPDSYLERLTNSIPVRRGFIPSTNGFANALSLAKFYSSLISETDGIRLLKEETIERTTKLCRHPEDPLPPEWDAFGLGYGLIGEGRTPGIRFGHGGALGSEGFADREGNFAFAFTKNKDIPEHPLHKIRDRISAVLGLPERHW